MCQQTNQDFGMKRLGITQRVVFAERIKERRDVLDQRWYDFADALGAILIPIPNNLKDPARYVEELEIDGLIFSGGNNIGIKSQDLVKGKSIEEDDIAYERDKTELALLKWAISKEKPLVGVCRGLQFINVYFGGLLSKVDPDIHVAKTHAVKFKEWVDIYSQNAQVNSYHNFGLTISDLAEDFSPTALYLNEVEGLSHKTFNIKAIMWHPERYTKIRTEDINFFKRSLCLNSK